MTTVLVWDDDADHPHGRKVLSWRSYRQTDSVISIPRFLDDHAQRLRSKYLAFVHELGETRIRGKRLVEHLARDDEFSLWWMTPLAEKNPFNSPAIYSCLRLLALEEILEDERPSRLDLVSSDGDLAEAMEDLCAKLDIAFAWNPVARPARLGSKTSRNAALNAVGGLVHLARQVKTKWRLRRLDRPAWFAGESSVFLCSYFIHLDPELCRRGQFYSRQWEGLPKRLHDLGKNTNWLQHFFYSSDVPNTRVGLDWVRRFNRDSESQGQHAFVDTFLSWGLVLRVLKEYVWLLRLSWRTRGVESAFSPTDSAVWLWPFLRAEWTSSIGGPVAMSNLLWTELFDTALKSLPRQSLGLYLYENQPWERALLRAWRRHGHGEIIGVQHATAPYWHLYYFDDPRTLKSRAQYAIPLPNRVALNGPDALRAFREAGYPAEQLVEVEALRYLALERNPAVSGGADAALEHRESPARVLRILVLGDMIRTSTQAMLQLIAESRGLYPRPVRFTIKAHPNNPIALDTFPGLLSDETTEALPGILGNFDIVFAACGTSAAVDAYLAGLPVIIHLDGNHMNLSPLRGQPAVRFVSSPEEFAQALELVPRRSTFAERASEFFFLDPELARWERVLSTATPGLSAATSR